MTMYMYNYVVYTCTLYSEYSLFTSLLTRRDFISGMHLMGGYPATVSDMQPELSTHTLYMYIVTMYICNKNTCTALIHLFTRTV